MTRTKTQKKTTARTRRHSRVRTRVYGTSERPRLSVFRSNRYVYAQLVDDESGLTLAAADSRKVKSGKPIERAQAVGEIIAKTAKGKKITNVVFDRGGFLYAGQVAAVAEGARAGGLEF